MTDDEPLILTAAIGRTERYRPATAPLWRALDWAVSWLPSHPDSRRGRKNAAQLRIVLLVVGVLTLAFGGETIWLILGGLVAASALVVPLPDVKKRMLRARFRRRMTAVRQQRTSGRVVYDGRRLVLEEDDKNLRRVLVDRGTHRTTVGRLGANRCLAIAPKSDRKAETIWVCAATDEAGASQGMARAEEEFDPKRVDLPAYVSPSDLERLEDALTPASGTRSA